MKEKLLTRRQFLTLGALGVTLGVAAASRLILPDQDARKELEYQKKLAEVPVPEETPNMKEFAAEMSVVFPDQGLTLEHIRTGKYDESKKTFEIDRYHLVFYAGNAERTVTVGNKLDKLYNFIRDSNEANKMHDRIGTSKQALLFIQDSEGLRDQELTIPARSQDLVGIAIRGMTNFRSEGQSESLYLLVGGPSNLEIENAAPDMGFRIRPITFGGDYKEPFVFDTAVRMGPTP